MLHSHTLPHLPRDGVFQGLSMIDLRSSLALTINEYSSRILKFFFCSLVKFLTPSSGLEGYWDPYPIDMEFRPPCMVLSTIGISKPGKLEGKSTSQCSTHLHQLHVCLPSSRNKTRLLYRMSLDFAPLLKHVPLMHILWKYFAEQVIIHLKY